MDDYSSIRLTREWMGSSSTLRVLTHCFSYDRAWMHIIPCSIMITKRLRPLGTHRLSTHLPQSVPEYGGLIDIRLTIQKQIRTASRTMRKTQQYVYSGWNLRMVMHEIKHSKNLSSDTCSPPLVLPACAWNW